MSARIRVLVVDDSAFARKVLREVLSADDRFEVVGTAIDGLDALEKISALEPDVITLDLVMPQLDGIGVLHALPEKNAPQVVVVSMSDGRSDLVLQALEDGALDVVQKPTALATDQLYELGAELREKLVTAASAAVRPAVVHTPRLPPVNATREGRFTVIGASTGGPQALTRLLSSLPADFPSPVAIVLHIPVGYTEALARRLDSVCALEVVEAYDGLEFKPGRVVLARAGMHLKVRRHTGALRAELALQPLDTPHTPAVDVLFESAAKACGADVLAVVLTGMGNDGLKGSQAIRAAGGTVLTEAQSSCVVYGMPRVVAEAKLAAAEADIGEMAALMTKMV